MKRHWRGARQIGFTVVAISLSLIAAFIPLIFMEGAAGRVLREFSMTLVFAIIVSTFVALTVTPMICAHHMRMSLSERRSRFDRVTENTLDAMIGFYGRTLRTVLRFPILTLLVFLSTVALTVTLYIKTPKSYFPNDDPWLVIGGTRAAPDISFQAMLALQQKVADIVLADPAVASIGSSMGGGSNNRGQMFISLKPLAERGGMTRNR